jgi:hypothetical protein
MGVQTVLRDDPVYYRRLLRFWKAILAEQIESAPRGTARVSTRKEGSRD